ncbi:MAG: cytochrome b/b6 domain-containing protein [Ruminococcus sp.]|nr:cytochrome b/b6 domain-containing protein [Ruminococcus sp.]
MTKGNKKKTANIIIDLSMVVLMPLLMAYSLIGEEFHEIIGTLIFILFIVHHILHLKWWKAIPHGKYNVYRIFITAFNFILLIVMFLQPLSGISMSKHIYTFLQLKGVAATARTIHIICAYWCYVLLSLHLGMHTDQIIQPLKSKKSFAKMKWIGRAVFILIAAYGIYVFIKRGFWGYMSGKTMFAFFDFSESRVLFIADYFAVMTLFAIIGNYLSKLLKFRRKTK